ncbi:uncharacterized protein LOC110888826 [Helianthus annuus]|uniref:uncharacterized protein LOC110888826 n=1 Tax=Helianthus annuus TaxID=4232 RepID=UPI000B90A342|nr:uncharacterized protein LOC110888826 [Helianthus annuus]
MPAPDSLLTPETINTTHNTTEFLALSVAAYFGLSSPRTLRLIGFIENQQVTILVDSGSTHNILQPCIASLLRLPTTPIKPFSVMVGNGEHLQCNGFLPQVPVTLNKHVFHTPCYVLPIEGADLVLGMEWLASLGPVMADFSIPSLTFNKDGQQCILQGDSFNSLVSPSSLSSLMRHTSVASLHTMVFQHQPGTPPSITPLTHPNPTIQHLLHTYSQLFDTPHGLPPPRPHDHFIPTLPNAKPVNVRPYRYPHYQKQVMTELITEMLREGIIQPSHSPYSSPVLLVQKKDGSWRFCVDYRAFNAITIRDRFPIPTVDELLDELHGATIFSKIDLRAGYHQIRVAPCDVGKTAFRTIDGHYEFSVMPFGLTNAPSTFQSAMNDLFRPVYDVLS